VVDYTFQELDVPQDLIQFMPNNQLNTLIRYDLSAQTARELNDLLAENGFGRPVNVDRGVSIMQRVVKHMRLDTSDSEVFSGNGSTDDIQDLIDDDESIAELYQDAQDSNVEQIDDGTDPVINGTEFNKVEDIAQEFFGDSRVFDRFIDDTDNIDGDEVLEVVQNKVNGTPVDRRSPPSALASVSINNITIQTTNPAQGARIR